MTSIELIDLVHEEQIKSLYRKVTWDDVLMLATKARKNIKNPTFKAKLILEFETKSIEGVEQHKMEYNL